MLTGAEGSNWKGKTSQGHLFSENPEKLSEAERDRGHFCFF
jgi:hypothetical protein